MPKNFAYEYAQTCLIFGPVVAFYAAIWYLADMGKETGHERSESDRVVQYPYRKLDGGSL